MMAAQMSGSINKRPIIVQGCLLGNYITAETLALATPAAVNCIRHNALVCHLPKEVSLMFAVVSVAVEVKHHGVRIASVRLHTIALQAQTLIPVILHHMCVLVMSQCLWKGFTHEISLTQHFGLSTKSKHI